MISTITSISVIGVSLGVAALIVVLSVMNGFSEVVRDMLVGLDPHVRIVPAEARGFSNVDELIQVALDDEEVVDALPYVQGKALIVTEDMGEMNRVVIVRGVESEKAQAVSPVAENTVMGDFSLDRRNGRPGIVVGMNLGYGLSLLPATEEEEEVPVSAEQEGSEVQLLSAPGIERMLFQMFGAMPLSNFEVRGLYELEPTYDETHVYVALDEAQRLFRMKNEVSGIELRLTDLNSAAAVKARLQEKLDASNYTISTWYDLQKQLYDVMELEKWGASLIVALIVVVAAFNIIGSLTMVVIEKRHDIGVLQAMGVSKKNVRRIFITEGLLIGIIGVGSGTVLGLGIAWAQKIFGFAKIAGAESFILDAYPVAISMSDIILIISITLLLCIVAAIYPAYRAASIEPARAVQMGD